MNARGDGGQAVNLFSKTRMTIGQRAAAGEWRRQAKNREREKKTKERGDCMNAHEDLLTLSTRLLCV